MSSEEILLNRIESLEIKQAFQEDTIEQLNQVITQQSIEIQKLWDANRILKASLNEFRNGDQQAKDDQPPPHY